MTLLNGNTDSFVLITGAAVSTDYNVTYFEDPGRRNSVTGNVTTATTTTLIAAPNVRAFRQVLNVSVRNRSSSSSQTVTLAKSVSGTAYHLTGAITLQAGEWLEWTPSEGSKVFNASGQIKTNTLGAFQASNVLATPGQAMSSFSITKTLSGCEAVYVGKAPRAVDYISLCYKVLTAASVGAGTEFVEVAIATGTPVAAGNPTLTVVGFASAEVGALSSVGTQKTIVSVASGYNINEGDDVWLLAATSGGTSPVLHAYFGDHVLSGVYANKATTRPSSILGTPTAFTIGGVSVGIPQIIGVL